jgi:hypothetical protein
LTALDAGEKIRGKMQKTMAWAFEGRLNVIVHGAKSPTPLEWERFLAETIAQRTRARSASDRPERRTALVVLVVSYGGVPDGTQRMQLAKTIDKNAAPTVIMTDSPVMLSISRLLSFFNPRQKAVGLRAESAAFEFLDLTAEERTTAKRLRVELEAELELR